VKGVSSASWPLRQHWQHCAAGLSRSTPITRMTLHTVSSELPSCSHPPSSLQASDLSGAVCLRVRYCQSHQRWRSSTERWASSITLGGSCVVQVVSGCHSTTCSTVLRSSPPSCSRQPVFSVCSPAC